MHTRKLTFFSCNIDEKIGLTEKEKTSWEQTQEARIHP
jgi:hypothetical protein